MHQSVNGQKPGHLLSVYQCMKMGNCFEIGWLQLTVYETDIMSVYPFWALGSEDILKKIKFKPCHEIAEKYT